jgi:hypothetical protein
LLEEPIAGTELWRGRTYRDAPEVDAEIKVALGDTPEGPPGRAPQPGDFVRARVEFAEVYDLQGRMVSGPGDDKAAP